jgi:hypothetical protein
MLRTQKYVVTAIQWLERARKHASRVSRLRIPITELDSFAFAGFSDHGAIAML